MKALREFISSRRRQPDPLVPVEDEVVVFPGRKSTPRPAPLTPEQHAAVVRGFIQRELARRNGLFRGDRCGPEGREEAEAALRSIGALTPLDLLDVVIPPS